ncbi:alpha-hydroxy-acid oxidizing protein [Actinomadura rugatobispora]|uniref:Alpha-hydroxy-acid oxidizing protein n=1 Tax=Actinomadura rugatobispora TaxID=1994 RepID=A0ABW1ACL1_9ACTN|nr:hypothetical protein GCM10010200_081840 [Actinomadura rugatobispora]
MAADAAATLGALSAIADDVAGHAEVLLDGGVRRKSDVVKALCPGANTVCTGRPYLTGRNGLGPAHPARGDHRHDGSDECRLAPGPGEPAPVPVTDRAGGLVPPAPL